MEILNEKEVGVGSGTTGQTTPPQKNNNSARTSVFVGVLLIALGGLWMMNNLNVVGDRLSVSV